MNVESELRRRDAARAVPDDLVDGPRARATLTALTDGPPPATAGRARRRLFGPVRLGPVRVRPVWAVATAGVAAVAALVGTNLTVGSGTAYASWTATATVASPGEEARWAKACMRLWNDPEILTGQHHFRPAFVELRGKYAYTVLTGTNDHQANCAVEDRGNGKEHAGGGSEIRLKPDASPRGLVTGGIDASFEEHGPVLYDVNGRVGADVKAVDILLADTVVHATIHQRYFAAWWPDRLTGASPPMSAQNPKVRITMKDGTVRNAHMRDFALHHWHE